MSKSIDKIVIVGGGSAGWMSASTLISTFPEKQIIVIESPNIPTVGVGESTIGGIKNWCNLIGLTDNDFMKYCDASYKLSIRFTNFYDKDSGSFHYPFGVPDTSGNVAQRNDWYFKKFKYKETPLSDYADCMFSNMALVNQNKMSKDDHGKLPGYIFDRDAAYHFDATKFGAWLRDYFCKPKGVQYIQAEVKNTILNDDGIDYLILDNGEKITADLFIDCTGFKSMLLAGAMQEPFNSYTDMLPNNSAWATRVPYTDKQKQLVTYTDCEAIQNGWVWTIPLWSRIGTGYVYSDQYVSDEDALEEFKSHLKNKGIYREDLEYKNLKMRVGIHKRIWVKNVCAIGLSAGFIEPLESSGLFTVHEFLLKLVRTLYRGRVSQWDKDAFTASCIDQFREFAEFVSLHYALSHRNDTEYWREVGKRVYCKELIEQKHMPYHIGHIAAVNSRMKRFTYSDPDQWVGAHCIFTGMNYFATDPYAIKSYHYPVNTNWDMFNERAALHLNNKKTIWNDLVKDEPTLYEYLDNFYKE